MSKNKEEIEKILKLGRNPDDDDFDKYVIENQLEALEKLFIEVVKEEKQKIIREVEAIYYDCAEDTTNFNAERAWEQLQDLVKLADLEKDSKK